MFTNRKLVSVVLAAVLGIVGVFTITGVPYGHFNWSKSLAASGSYPGAGQPGCEIDIPDGSVVGSFVSGTPLYWSPNSGDASLSYSLDAGKTAWVIGQDQSKNFYKIVWVCQYLWVPKVVVGPDYDAVWVGTPLPTRIVE